MTAPTHRPKRPARSPISLVKDEDRYSSSPTPETPAPAEADATEKKKAPASPTKSRSGSRSGRSSRESDSGASPRKASSTKTGTKQATQPKRQSRAPSARGRGEAPPPTPPPAADSGALEGEQIAGEPRDAITVKIPRSLKARIDGLVTHSAMHGEPEEVESMTDFIRIATHRLVSHYEQTYHRGQPFPAPRRLTPGRRSRG